MKKRALLIVTGTIGALGGVFAITPPQFGNSATGLAGGTTSTPASTPAPTTAAEQTPTPTPSESATKKSTPAPSNNTSTPTPQASTPAAPSPTPAPTKASGGKVTVTGNSFAASERGRNWGNVTVKVTFENGAITAITGMQSPLSRGQWAFDRLDPYVSGQQITVAGIKSKSASALPYVSGVSYSSMAYWESLKSAISKAGL